VTDVAFTFTGVAEATTGGALYVVAADVVPVREPVAGLRAQFTPAPDESLSTNALMGSVLPCPIICGVLGVRTT
jgi:hypothetical protein